MNLRKSIKSLALLALALPLAAVAEEPLHSVTATRHGQMHSNLLASQRNIQDQIKTDETQRFLEHLNFDEEEEPEEGDIYDVRWNSQSVNPYVGMTVPNNVKIDVSEYSMPVPGYLTSPYGYRKRFRRMHKGVDLRLNIGDTVRSAFDGKVRITRYEARGYGYYVVVRHTNGLETVYGHLSKFLVKPNQMVKAGEPIALGGNTGRSTGPHLHFETRYMGYAINPMAIFAFPNQTTQTDYYVFNKSTYKNARNYYPEANSQLAEKWRSTSKKNTVAAKDTQKQEDLKQQAKSKKGQKNKYSASSSKKSKTHKVKSGESLYTIARKNGTTVAKLKKLNGIKGDNIQIGQSLKVR